MPIYFRCPKCQQVLTTADTSAGMKISCVKCGQRLLVPAPLPPPPLPNARNKTVLAELAAPPTARVPQAKAVARPARRARPLWPVAAVFVVVIVCVAVSYWRESTRPQETTAIAHPSPKAPESPADREPAAKKVEPASAPPPKPERKPAPEEKPKPVVIEAKPPVVEKKPEPPPEKKPPPEADYGRAQKREAILSEEIEVAAQIREQHSHYPTKTEVVFDYWGPHILEGIVYPPAKDPHDGTVVLGDFDQRKPAKYIRVVYRVVHPELAQMSHFEAIYVFQNGRVINKLPQYRRPPSSDWRTPYFEYRARSIMETRKMAPPPPRDLDY